MQDDTDDAVVTITGDALVIVVVTEGGDGYGK